jgi:sRNA-binding carbon storage regulator CsrA
MLVLTRKQLRSVAVAGPNGCELMLNVTVREIQGGSVRLSLEVNTDSPVYRREVSDGIRTSGPSKGAAAPVAQWPLGPGP